MQTYELPVGLELGTDVIDRQHARFFTLMNNLIEADVAAVDRDLVGEIIGELADYVHTHFRTEEELMERAGFPGLEEHQFQHAGFAARVEDFQRKYAAGEIGVEHEIMAHLVGWFTNHIRQEDTRYASLFREHGF